MRRNHSKNTVSPKLPVHTHASAFRIFCGAILFSTLTTLSPAAEWLLSGELGAHDPSIIKEEGGYPNGNWWWSPATGLGLSMKFSLDGIKWRQGIAFFTADNEPTWWMDYAPAMRKLNVWAPDIRKLNDRFWCFYSISEFGKNNSAIGLTSSTGIFRGDWRDDGAIISSKQNSESFNAVDPSLTVDADGKPWLVFGSYFDGIHIVQLNPETMKPLTEAPYATIARRQKELGLEGANIVFLNGYYYLFAAIDICCNGKVSTAKIACGRSKTITGPYEGKKADITNAVSGMLTSSLTIFEKGDERWAGMGGPYVYQYGDGWIIVRHGYDKNTGGAPKMRINDLYWDAEGWPTYTAHPLPDQTVEAGKSITFKAPSSITYQWQVYANDSTTWTNIGKDTPNYSIGTAFTLSVKATSTMNGYKYRVITGNGSTTSNTFTLTVTPAP